MSEPKARQTWKQLKADPRVVTIEWAGVDMAPTLVRRDGMTQTYWRRRSGTGDKAEFESRGGAMTIAALFVATGGAYFGLDGVDPWDAKRDARLYPGPHPVVAHPPCERWGNFWMGSPSIVARTGARKRLGDDDGCFASALESVRRWGGVLEHPAGSKAWATFGLVPPEPGGHGPTPTSAAGSPVTWSRATTGIGRASRHGSMPAACRSLRSDSSWAQRSNASRWSRWTSRSAGLPPSRSGTCC